MARYRKVDTRIWNDEKFREFSDDGKLAFLFVLTHPNLTSLGAMRATIAGLASEIGWKERKFRASIAAAQKRGMAEFDEAASLAWLPNFLRYNAPESPNVVRSWEGALDLLPECDLKRRLVVRVLEYVESLGEGFREALPEAFRKGMPNQEQEQEQEQEPEQEEERAGARVTSMDDFDLPYRSEKFREAFAGWLEHRRRKRQPLEPDGKAWKIQRKELVEWGEADAIRSIETSISSGWQGLFPTKPANGNGSRSQPQSFARGKFHETPMKAVNVLRAEPPRKAS